MVLMALYPTIKRERARGKETKRVLSRSTELKNIYMEDRLTLEGFKKARIDVDCLFDLFHLVAILQSNNLWLMTCRTLFSMLKRQSVSNHRYERTDFPNTLLTLVVWKTTRSDELELHFRARRQRHRSVILTRCFATRFLEEFPWKGNEKHCHSTRRLIRERANSRQKSALSTMITSDASRVLYCHQHGLKR